MSLPVLSNRYTILIAGLLAISIPVGAQPVTTNVAEESLKEILNKTALDSASRAADEQGRIGEPVNGDPYFTPTAAKSTSYISQVIIRNIRQDRAGNIWFATFGGPIRYDGKDFTNFSEEVGLANTRVFSLLEDRSGALWFGSITGGASRYDGKSFTKFTDKDGLGNNDVTWIFEDRDANIWFGTGNGASRYDGKSMTNFTTKDGLVHNSVYTIGQDAAGRIWFGTQGGICSYDGKSFTNLADKVGRSFINIRSLAVDRTGNLWFGGQEGAFRYDGKTLTTFTSKEGLLDDFVGSMIVDKAGNLWLGHPGQFPSGQGGGASHYDGKSFQHFTQKDGLGSKTVYCMLEDKAGNIWFGSADAGACRYDGKTFTHFSATTQNTKPAKGETVSELSKSTWSVFQDKNNNHWFGSNGQGVYRYDGKVLTQFTTKYGLPDNQIRGIQQNKSGDIFINTTKGISKFDGQIFTTLKVAENHQPGSGWKLQPDDLWFAGAQNSGAVYRYDGTSLHQLAFPKTKRGDDHYASLPRDKFPNAKYTPYDVYTIYRDRRGHMWFGSADLGAVRYDGKTFDWLYEDHLTNVPEGGSFGIRSIAEDKEGKFWICNTRHRYNITPNNPIGNGLIDYKQEPGLGDLKAQVGEDSFYFASAITDKQGHLWMTTYNEGVWRYDGKTLIRYPVKASVKEIWIQSIYQDNRGVLWLGTNDAGAFKFNGKTFEQFKPSGQDKNPEANPSEKPTVAKGETVSEMAKDLGHVFQAKDGRHWFSSGSEGAFRYDGKTITRFTKKDGLAGDGVGGVQEDKSGNLYFSTNGGISKFDGQSFTTLEPKAAGEWKKEPDDLWFSGGQDSGVVYRYDGKSLHRLAFPKTKAGDDATLPRDKFPNAKYSPYDVYTIFKDSKGNLWFGTAVLGTCRYDGKSFTWIPEEELRNDSFGTRSIIEEKDGKFWFSNTLHRYAVDRSDAAGQGNASQWYKKEKGIGDLSGHKQGEYDYFMSSTLGDDGAMWLAILGGVVWRYDGKTMTHYPVTENGKHHWIFSIYKDNDGVLWLGTQAHGAYRFNGKTFEKFKP